MARKLLSSPAFLKRVDLVFSSTIFCLTISLKWVPGNAKYCLLLYGTSADPNKGINSLWWFFFWEASAMHTASVSLYSKAAQVFWVCCPWCWIYLYAVSQLDIFEANASSLKPMQGRRLTATFILVSQKLACNFSAIEKQLQRWHG